MDLRGQIYGVKAVLPILREQRRGTIIGVSSGLGVRAVLLMIPYCVAKSGVSALHEGQRLEERHAESGVHVTTILPASVDTPFPDSTRSWTSVRPAPIPPVCQPKAVAEAPTPGERSRGRRGRPVRATTQPLDAPGRLPPHPGQDHRHRFGRHSRLEVAPPPARSAPLVADATVRGCRARAGR